MVQAKIQINGVDGSNDDLPINTLVQLNNHGTGGELTYAWSITYQPMVAMEAPDALSSAVIINPTFTPTKEGTYRIKLVVNAGLGTEKTDTVIVGILQLKTRMRVLATGETTEDVSWSDPVNRRRGANEHARQLDMLMSNPVVAVYATDASGLSANYVAICTGTADIKSGLPGEETVVQVGKALATSTRIIDEPLSIVTGPVPGGTALPANGALAVCRRYGLLTKVTVTGATGIGDAVYVSDTGTLTATPGTYPRIVGIIVGDVGPWSVLFDGIIVGTGSYTYFFPGALAGAAGASAKFCNQLFTSAIATAAGLAISTSTIPFTLQRHSVFVVVRINVVANTLTTDTVFSLYKNGGSVGSVTVGAAGTGPFDISPSHITFAQGDTWDVLISNTAGGGGNSIIVQGSISVVEVT